MERNSENIVRSGLNNIGKFSHSARYSFCKVICAIHSTKHIFVISDFHFIAKVVYNNCSVIFLNFLYINVSSVREPFSSFELLEVPQSFSFWLWILCNSFSFWLFWYFCCFWSSGNFFWHLLIDSQNPKI